MVRRQAGADIHLTARDAKTAVDAAAGRACEFQNSMGSSHAFTLPPSRRRSLIQIKAKTVKARMLAGSVTRMGT